MRKSVSHIPSGMASALDIGCDDGFLLNRLGEKVTRKDGLDPRHGGGVIVEGAKLRRGFFPADVAVHEMLGPYDAIFALAVFEHFTEQDLTASARLLPQLLSPKGRLIITVPHPFVDRILDVLMFLRLVDGQAAEEHHGFNPADLLKCFASSLRLVVHKRFQFGLNNIFVYERM